MEKITKVAVGIVFAYWLIAMAVVLFNFNAISGQFISDLTFRLSVVTLLAAIYFKR